MADTVGLGDPLDLSWARRFALWASYAFGQPLPQNQPGTGRNAFAHESGIHADGALKDRATTSCTTTTRSDRSRRTGTPGQGRVVLTGEYGGKAGFRHVLDGLGIDAGQDEDLVFQLVQLCASATGKPLTDDELRLIAAYPRQLALLYPGELEAGRLAAPELPAELASAAGTAEPTPLIRVEHRIGDGGNRDREHDNAQGKPGVDDQQDKADHDTGDTDLHMRGHNELQTPDIPLERDRNRPGLLLTATRRSFPYLHGSSPSERRGQIRCEMMGRTPREDQMTLSLPIEPQANELLSRDGFAMLLAMMLDQQVPFEKAFNSPYQLALRLGHEPTAQEIADFDPDALADIFARRPALHRFPRAMAARAQELARIVADRYDGDASAVWATAKDGADLRRRLAELPGYGTYKAQITIALLGKQLGIQPDGWREAAGHFGEAGSHYSVADISDDSSLAAVRSYKKAAESSSENGRPPANGSAPVTSAAGEALASAFRVDRSGAAPADRRQGHGRGGVAAGRRQWRQDSPRSAPLPRSARSASASRRSQPDRAPRQERCWRSAWAWA